MKAYEWCYETWDENNDIIDNYHADRLADFSEAGKTNHLCLILNIGDEINGVEDRLWAYVENGKLPEFFSDGGNELTGYKVPIKFHKELNNCPVS